MLLLPLSSGQIRRNALTDQRCAGFVVPQEAKQQLSSFRRIVSRHYARRNTRLHLLCVETTIVLRQLST
jgi:hypothetical protein